MQVGEGGTDGLLPSLLARGCHNCLIHHRDGMLAAAASAGIVQSSELDPAAADQLQALLWFALGARHRHQDGADLAPGIRHQFIGRV